MDRSRAQALHRSGNVLIDSPRTEAPAFRGLPLGDFDAAELVVGSKLRPPRLPPDLVDRPRLRQKLDRGLDTAVSVVSAPAGYGKTTLVSHWLETSDYPGAWVSLEDRDDGVASFVIHLVAAIRKVAPNSMERTMRYVRRSFLPGPGPLSLALLNDLGDIEEQFVLVLDGTESIRDLSSHQLLSSLLQHLPVPMRIVLVGRTDPFVALASLRVAARITEVRVKDLRFTPDETLTLLEKGSYAVAGREAATAWTEATEGWVTGLKLAIAENDAFPADDKTVRALTGRVQEYLLYEVLERQPPPVRRFLLCASILDRLCEPVCGVLFDEERESGSGRSADADHGLQFLRNQGLFVIPDDARGEWFRFHSLVRQFLARRRKLEIDPARERELHRRAGRWFADNGHLEQAIGHAIGAGDPAGAADMVEDCAERLMDGGEWRCLREVVDRIPAEVVEERPRLLVTRAWTAFHDGRYGEAEATVELAESIHASENAALLQTIRSSLAGARGDFEGAMAEAREALTALDEGERFHRGVALANLYEGCWVAGDRGAADALAASVLSNGAGGMPAGGERLLGLMCSLRWALGDLAGLEEATAACEAFARKATLPRMMALAQLYRGLMGYARNDLARAQEHLEAALEFSDLLSARESLDVRYGLASVYRAQGRHVAARAIAAKADNVLPFRTRSGAPEVWHHRALRADFALAYGDTRTALQLVEAWEQPLATPEASSFHPGLMLARILLQREDEELADRARSVLSELQDVEGAVVGDRFRIELRCLEALLHRRDGNEAAALERMSESLTLAEPAGFVRHFIDRGPAAAELMKPLGRTGPLREFVRGVLTAYYEDTLASGVSKNGSGRPPADMKPVDALTPKEMETLQLLTKGLYNKEIAERSFVSVETVKTHLKHIYRKLNVANRRQAVSRARAMGLLGDA